MAVISEDSINEWIVPHLSKGKRGPEVWVKLSETVSAIIYRLKTGCQWRELPADQFFKEESIGWQDVYHHFSKWVKDGSFRKVWMGPLNQASITTFIRFKLSLKGCFLS